MPYNREVVMKRWDWIKFLGIELDSVGVEVMKDGFPWKDVDACLGNEVGPPIEGMTTCPECGCELRWIHFCSPSVTWVHECGRAGSLAICEDCHKQVYFRCEMMN